MSVAEKQQVDVDTLSDQQVDEVRQELSRRCLMAIKKATTEINDYANVYGLEVMLGFSLVKAGEANLIKKKASENG